MKCARITCWCLSLAVWLSAVWLFAAWPAIAETPAPGEDQWTAVFQQHVRGWIEGVAKQDAQFRDWSGAQTEVRSLGTNSHQWIVTLRKADKTVGYLIVGERPPADPERMSPSFVLLEYGLGESILFGDAFAPRVQQAEPVYDGFSSYWQVSVRDQRHLIDAKTGETYPAHAQPDPAVLPTLGIDHLIRPEQQLMRSRVLTPQPADPFDHIDWLKTHTAQPAVPKVSQWPPSARAVVNASLFHGEVWAPFVVGTIHEWNGGVTYVGVWDDGLRFLPLAYVTKVGRMISWEAGPPRLPEKTANPHGSAVFS